MCHSSRSLIDWATSDAETTPQLLTTSFHHSQLLPPGCHQSCAFTIHGEQSLQLLRVQRRGIDLGRRPLEHGAAAAQLANGAASQMQLRPEFGPRLPLKGVLQSTLEADVAPEHSLEDILALRKRRTCQAPGSSVHSSCGRLAQCCRLGQQSVPTTMAALVSPRVVRAEDQVLTAASPCPPITTGYLEKPTKSILSQLMRRLQHTAESRTGTGS